MYEDYGQMDEAMMEEIMENDDRMAAEAHQMELEQRQREEEEAEERWIDSMAAVEDERNFNVLTPWDF